MSIGEEQPVAQTTGAKNAGGDLQVKGLTEPDSEAADKSNDGGTTADRPSQPQNQPS